MRAFGSKGLILSLIDRVFMDLKLELLALLIKGFSGLFGPQLSFLLILGYFHEYFFDFLINLIHFIQLVKRFDSELLCLLQHLISPDLSIFSH